MLNSFAMKKLSYLLGFFLVGTLALYNCKPEDEAELGAPFDKIEGLQGTWEVSSALLIDEESILKDETDLNEFYTSDPTNLMSITFLEDDSTFQVNPGSGKNYFGTSGIWKYDDPRFPQFIYLIQMDSAGFDTTMLQMGSVVDPYSTQVRLKYPRYCGNTNVSSYEFTFVRK